MFLMVQNIAVNRLTERQSHHHQVGQRLDSGLEPIFLGRGLGLAYRTDMGKLPHRVEVPFTATRTEENT
ncbi:hypothetical protein KBJ94_23385 [Pseudomonas sp. ITA]|uniref:hypothetical protein n=1 Tax=Pseudomonas sp. ITA TaxID=2825841 RepID=UPI0024960EA1|nr:hypothetical protein [Pseudomonas sp. ITA]MDI2144997.1 hypothetical protein [Pseudomonas sp. ITA]